MAEKHGMETIIPGMEPTGHYWLNLGAYLQEQGMKPVHVNPHHVKKSKELDDNNPRMIITRARMTVKIQKQLRVW